MLWQRGERRSGCTVLCKEGEHLLGSGVDSALAWGGQSVGKLAGSWGDGASNLSACVALMGCCCCGSQQAACRRL